jgi:PKD repeat protein/N-acetylneuraminic acid mutarotase
MSNRSQRALVLVLALLWLLSSSLASSATARSEGPGQPSTPTPVVREAPLAQEGPVTFAPGRLIVQFRPGVRLVSGSAGLPRTGWPALDGILAGQQVLGSVPLFQRTAGEGQPDPRGLARIYVLQLPADRDVPAAVAALSANPDVAWAEPDYLAYAADTTPNDPLFAKQWGLAKIQAPAAWDVVTGTAAVAIAIVDSGLDLTHPDLAGKVWVNPGEIPGNGLDDDNNGLVDDVYGWDFVNEVNDPSDDNGHGTQVGGVAAAATDNGTGVAGVCWGCRLMAVKVMQGGVANYSDIAQGVLYAAQKGAKVINLSLGGYSNSQAVRTAVQAAVEDYGAVVVAGAGNDSSSMPFYPAAYPEVLAVAGTDAGDLKWSGSNYGSWVDVSAPAVAITTTYMGGDYGPADGTSFSTSFASGLAGLVRSQHPGWSPALVRAQVVHTADPIDALNPGYEGLLGYGRINAAGAVTEAPHPLLVIAGTAVNGDPLGRPVPGEAATLEVTLANDWWTATNVAGVLSTTDPDVTIDSYNASYGTIPPGGTGTSDPPYSFTVAGGAGYNHPILFTLTVMANGGGYITTIPFTITTCSGEEPVGGTIFTDTVWMNDKTYVVQSNVGIMPGVTLTIQPGTEVHFNGNYSLNVGGTLIADGTETQPIRFKPHAGGSWGRIYFDDTSVDATATVSGTYLAGDVLRYVRVEGAAQGIGCNNATPFLEQVTTDGGGVDCTAGSTPLWLSDSVLGEDVTVSPGTDSPDAWTARSDMPTARWHLGVAATTNGKIYAMGGMPDGYHFIATNEEYDPATDTWSPRASMPTARCALGVAAASNGRIYAIGGDGGRSTVEEYNPAANTWVTRSSMPTPRFCLGVAAASNGKLYAVGGIDYTPLATVEEYDPALDTWASRSSMPTARYCIAVVAAANGKIYAIGGTDGSNWLDTVEEYDPATDAWISKAAMPTARSGMGAVAASNGRIYVIGGWAGVSPLTTVEEYDPATDTWTTRPSMPTARKYLAVATAGDGKIYAIGGTPDYVVALSIVEVYTVPAPSFFYHVIDTTIVDGALHVPDVSQVLTSTVQGGISAGDGSLVQGNDIEGSPGWGIAASGTVTITHNRLVGNASGIQVSGGVVQGNLIASNAGTGIEIDGNATVVSNTLTANAGSAIQIVAATAVTLTGNNLEFNTGPYDVENLVLHSTMPTVPAQGNWWGTTDPGAINQRIYDFLDDYTLGQVLYTPVATGPVQTAPAYVPQVTVDPNPVGIEMAAFEVELSREMVTDTVPAIGFYSGTAAYSVTDNPQWLDASHYRVTYDVTTLVPRGTYTITVDGAVGADGIEIAPNTAFTFTVDYAGEIGDTTPPPPPIVLACGADTPDTLSAQWYAHDPESDITLYGYAIGSTPGGGDVVNWTNTTDTSFLRTGLNILAGQTYYVAVQARNEGGLWSEPGVSSGVVAGSGTCPDAAFFATPVSGMAPLAVQFTDASTGTVEAWLWDFGNAVTSTLQSPSHVYTATGVYTVSLLVSGPGGSDLLVRPDYITVTERITPSADFTAAPLSGPSPLTVTFTDTSSGPITAWLWDFGDAVTSTVQNPSHVYSAAGAYTVSLLVSGPGGSDLLVRPGYITVTPPAGGYRIYLPLVLRGSGN